MSWSRTGIHPTYKFILREKTLCLLLSLYFVSGVFFIVFLNGSPRQTILFGHILLYLVISINYNLSLLHRYSIVTMVYYA